MQDKPLVIHLIKSLENGGCERMLLRTLPLVEGFDHLILTLGPAGQLEQQFRSVGIKVESLGSVFRLLPEISRLQPNIVITYLFHGDFWGRMIIVPFTRIPVIPFLRTTYNYPGFWPARLFTRLTAFMVPHYLANSISVRDYHTHHFGINPEKIIVLENGIDTKIFRPRTAARTLLRHNLRLPDSAIILICVANFHSHKGHSQLLSAFDIVFQKHPNTWLLLAGKGPTRTRLENQIADYKSRRQIIFLGERRDIPCLLAGSDIFVLPTLFEGMSNAILEAMSCGLPCVVSDIAENRELIRTNLTGILTPVGNSSVLASTLSSLIRHPEKRRKLGSRARQDIIAHHDLPVIGSKMKQLLNLYVAR